jgi:hypothetical protein
MTEFDPPLRLAKNTVVITLDDAAVFARSFHEARLPRSREAVLRLIESACSDEERRLAANGFGAWIRAESALRTVV